MLALALPGPLELILLALLFIGYATLTFLAAIVAFARKTKHRGLILLLCFIGLFVPIAWLGLILWAALDDLEERDRSRHAFEVVRAPTHAEFSVRDATDADAAAVADIARHATAQLRQVYRPTEQAIQQKQQMSHNLRQIVACADQQIVGTVQVAQEDGRLHLIGLAVDPEWRRRGVARALIDWIAQHAPRLSLYTIVETGNVPIFEQLGFRVIRTVPAEHIEPSGLSEAYMERPAPRRNEASAQLPDSPRPAP
jgi:predicted N-acetyltransferase YhbS